MLRFYTLLLLCSAMNIASGIPVNVTTTLTLTSATVPTRTLDTDTSKIERKLPFLKGVDEMNRQEFFAIIRNEGLRKTQIWEAVEEWAKKQTEDVQLEVLEFHQQLSTHVENSKLRVSKIIKTLPDALSRLSSIVQDVELTRVQEKNRIANLYSSLDEDVSKTLQFIIQMISYEKNEGKKLEQRLKLRKLKKGGIWRGSVQATEIV